MSANSVTSAHSPLLVRDVMTIGVPTCRDTEPCGAVAARLSKTQAVPVVVALDDEAMACGWTTLARLREADPAQPVSAVIDEDIPDVPPDIPAAAAAQMMRDRQVEYLFLMHNWPGVPRPAALVSLQAIENRIRPKPGGP
jgi:hypothetical protein